MGKNMVQGKAYTSTTQDYARPLKTNKHNINIEEAPKMAIIGDYWDQETMTQVVYPLKECEYLFPRSFS
jgi:thiamine pyrophosphokinase